MTESAQTFTISCWYSDILDVSQRVMGTKLREPSFSIWRQHPLAHDMSLHISAMLFFESGQ